LKDPQQILPADDVIKILFSREGGGKSGIMKKQIPPRERVEIYDSVFLHADDREPEGNGFGGTVNGIGKVDTGPYKAP
jgi:hypothetical protein